MVKATSHSLLLPFLYISLPLLTIAALIGTLFYKFEAANHLQLIHSKEISIVGTGQQLVRDSVAPVLHDLDYLVALTQNAIGESPEAEDFPPTLLQWLIPILSAYSEGHSDYDQIRLIDRDGYEKIRIDNSSGKPVVAQEQELQNKAHRYYFVDTMSLGPDKQYMSPLDLNIEHGVIEQPLKPMIRFGKVLINRRGEKAGIIMINYKAQTMLQKLHDWSDIQPGDLLLLNSEGYYLHNPDAQQEWGFMLPERSGSNFSYQHPDVWQNQIAKFETGQITTKGKTFTFATVRPLSPTVNIISSTGSPLAAGHSTRPIPSQEYNWKLVSITTPSLLYQSLEDFRRSFVAVAVTAMLLFVILSWFLARAHVRRKLDKKALLESKEQLEQKVTLRTRKLYDQNLHLTSEIERRKTMERELVKSEEKYEAIMSAMDDGAYIVSPDRHLLYSNPALLRRVGQYDPNDFCYKIIYNRNEICPWCNLDTVCQGQSSHYELTSDVNGKTYHVSNNPIILNDNKVGKLTISRDITKTRHTEKALARTEMYFSTLLNTMREGLVAANLDERVTYCNKQFAEMLGHPEDTIIGSFLTDFVAPQDRDYFLGELQKRRNRDVAPYEISWRNSAGESVLTKVSPALLYSDDGQLTGSFAIISDITEIRKEENRRRQLENQLQQTQKMEALGTLAGGIAHDFNNILTAIMGYSSLALEVKHDHEEVLDCLREINIAGNRAVQLVGQILAFSRQSVKDKQPLEIIPIVKEVLKLIRTATPLSVKIELETNGDLVQVVADPTQIHQIVMNLCTNSYQAMGDKGGKLQLLVERATLAGDNKFQLAGGDYVHLQVRDTGPGIPAHLHRQIFDPFFTTKEKGKGTGLGLSVVHSIVEDLGGAIDVASNEGSGTTFDIYLPVSMQEQENKTDVSEKLFLGNGESIIWLDDEQPLVRLGCQILKSLGYKPTGYSEPKSCIKEIANNPDKYELLVTDYNMPDMNGLEVAEQVRQLNPAIKIILCTGFSDIVMPENSGELGIHDYLLKPVHKLDIARSVYKALAPRFFN